MSKLDDIAHPITLKDPLADEGERTFLVFDKADIKALMLELIDNTGVYHSEVGHWTVNSESLKKKVQDL